MMRKKYTKGALKGYLKRNGLYIAVSALVIAGTIASVSAITALLDVGGRQSPLPDSLVSAEPTTPQPVEETVIPEPEPEKEPEPEARETVEYLETQPLMPVHIRPVSGELVQPFSGEELVYNETLGEWRTHNGADYAAKDGEEVLAVFSGEVLRAENDAQLGNTVELKLDSGYTVRIAGLKDIAVKAGERLSQGDVIGTAGNSSLIESSAGTQIHFELMSGDKLLDPETLFS